MHWNVALDALPGSATFVRVLDRWCNDCFASMRSFPINDSNLRFLQLFSCSQCLINLINSVGFSSGILISRV